MRRVHALPAGFVVLFLITLAVPPAFGATFRYSSTSNRIYVEGGGAPATLTDIKAALPRAPLDLVDPAARTWLLRADLYVTGGSALVLHGSAAGGDVNELRLKSDNVSGGFIQVTADYGSLDLASTRVISWNAAASGPDTEYATFGRAFVRVRSSLAADGVTAHESRMDVVDSEIGWLGYNTSESYGLVWKVLGTSAGIFDRVQVRGNIIHSHIHDNYFGVYTFGLQDGLWRDSEVDHNAQYGFDPHDDSDNLLVENNDIHDNGNHGFIASQRCDHAVIRGNRSWNNGANGFMLHRLSDDALVEDNQADDNLDSGIAIFASARAQVRNNTVLRNGNAGIRLSNGAADNQVENNEIGDNRIYGLYLYRGTDAPNPGDDGRMKRNRFAGNSIHDTHVDALKMSDSDGTTFTGNLFIGNAGMLRVGNSSAMAVSGNTLQDTQFFVLSGAVDAPTDVTFTAQPFVQLTQDSKSTARFVDAAHGIFHAVPEVATTIDSSGSVMTLTAAQTGGSTAVVPRALFVFPGTTVDVITGTWNTGSDTTKRWTSTSPGGSTAVHYTVGELTRGAFYKVLANGKRIALLRANSNGALSFDHPTGGTSPVTYVVTGILQ